MPHSSCGSHVESSTTRCSATFAMATTATSAERTNPVPRPADRGARRRGFAWPTPRGGPYGPPDARRVCRRPLRAACALRTGAGVPDAMRAARALHPGTAREITWSARGSEGREERADLGIRAGTGPGRPRTGAGLEARRLPYDDQRAPETACTPAAGTRRPGTASGGEPVHPFPEAAADPAVPQGCWAAWLRDTGTTGHGPICLPRAADLAVSDEEVWQAGNWPESAATCLRCPWCRCGRSCGCRGSCRRRGCWSGRHSR